MAYQKSSSKPDRRPGKRYPRDNGDKPMFDAFCSYCQKECKVPFKPSSGRPIYCNDCFAKQNRPEGGKSSDHKRGGDKTYRRADNRSGSSASNDVAIQALTKQIELLNHKLDTIIDVVTSIEEGFDEAEETDLLEEEEIVDIEESDTTTSVAKDNSPDQAK